jgi:hypothetical protein
MPPGPISVAPGDLILGGSGGGAIVWSSLSLGTLASISQGISASVASPSGTAVKYPVGVTLGGGAVGKLPPLPLTVEGSGIALPPGVTLQR